MRPVSEIDVEKPLTSKQQRVFNFIKLNNNCAAVHIEKQLIIKRPEVHMITKILEDKGLLIRDKQLDGHMRFKVLGL